VDVRDDDGNAPLHVAASGGLRESVTTLLAVSTLARLIINFTGFGELGRARVQ